MKETPRVDDAVTVPDVRLVVAVDRDILDMMPRYMKNRRADADRLLRAIAERDFDTVWTLGHNMTGSGTSYGLSAVTDLGGALVRAAEERDTEGASQLAHDLARFLDSVDVVCAVDAAVIPAR